jgi:hypothetical protein
VQLLLGASNASFAIGKGAHDLLSLLVGIFVSDTFLAIERLDGFPYQQVESIKANEETNGAVRDIYRVPTVRQNLLPEARDGPTSHYNKHRDL